MGFKGYIKRKAEQVRQARDDYMAELRERAREKKRLAKLEEQSYEKARERYTVKYAEKKAEWEADQKFRKMTKPRPSFGQAVRSSVDVVFGSPVEQYSPVGIGVLGAPPPRRRYRVYNDGYSKYSRRRKPKYRYRYRSSGSQRPYNVLGL